MTTYVFKGVEIQLDFETGEPIASGPASFSVVVEDKNAPFMYEAVVDPDFPDTLPEANFILNPAVYGSISGLQNYGGSFVSDLDVALGNVTSVAGTTTIYSLVDASDVEVVTAFLFAIDGVFAGQLQTFADLINFFAEDTVDSVVPTGPLAPDTEFTLSDMVFDSVTEKDTWYGSNANDEVRLGDGADFMDGGLGRDKLYGQKGFDEIYGGKGKDQLYGAGGRDTLDGGTGRDRLEGGTGDDFLTGGDAADVFYYRFDAKTDHDRIRDWEDGIDVIRFKGGSFEELTIEDSGPHVLISWGANSVRLNQTDFADISADDFDFI